MLIRTAKRVAVAVIGGTVVLIGIVLIVLPGPAFVVIPAGLAILATEFAWAKWMLKRARERTSSMFSAIFGGRTRAASNPQPSAEDQPVVTNARSHNEPPFQNPAAQPSPD